MKKLAAIFVAGTLLLGACSNDEEETTETVENTESAENTEADTPKETTEEGVDVDKGLFSVEVTVPAIFFEGEDMETVIADAEKEGVGEATLNEDGSVTYKMSKSQHKDMMDELAATIEEAKKEIVESGDYPSVKGLETSDNYDTFTLQVDREAFENSLDGFATITIGLIGSYYQAFDGTDAEDMQVDIELEDAATGEVFDTIVYPESLEEMGE